jgi:hypothetical protein
MFTWRAFGPSITLANRKMYAKRSPILKQLIILLSNKTSPETLFSLAFMRPHATRNIADNELEICWAKSKLRLRCVRAVLQYLGQESESTKKRQPITDFSACFEAIDHACGPRAAAATINPWNVNRIAQRLPLLTPGVTRSSVSRQDREDCDIKTHDKAITTANCHGAVNKEGAQCLEADFGFPKTDAAGLHPFASRCLGPVHSLTEAPPAQSGTSSPAERGGTALCINIKVS